MTVETQIKSLCGGCSNPERAEDSSMVGCALRSPKEQAALVTAFNKAIAKGEEVLPESICFAWNKPTLYRFEGAGSSFRSGRVNGIVDPGSRVRLGLGPV